MIFRHPTNQPVILEPLKPPINEIWTFILKLTKQKPTVITNRNSPDCNGDWMATRPYEICDQDKNVTPDRGKVFVYCPI